MSNDFGVQRPQIARLANVSAVMRYILAHGPTSRVDLATGIGLTQGPMTRIVSTLLRQGLVREAEAQPAASGRGRPRVPIAINPDAMHIIAVHIGILQVTVSRVDLAGGVVASVSRDHQATVASVVEMSVQLCTEFIALQEVPILGVGVSIGGWIDAEAGVVRRSELLHWNEVPLRDMLEERLGQTVLLESTVRSHAVADMLYGAVANTSNFLHVFIGNVIELATVVDGRVLTGINGFGGNLAAWRIDDGLGDSQHAIDVISDTAVRDIARREGLIPKGGTYEELLELSDSEDPRALRARRLVVERARRSARLLTSLAFAFGPQEIVVSSHGIISRDATKALQQEFDFLMDRYPRPTLTFSQNWQSAVATGGAAVVLDRALSDYLLLQPAPVAAARVEGEEAERVIV